ncbi:MAG TPA: hypothetical protein VEV84_12840 [Pyrinomonadaceae bacterium]|nr:hypothetical protein [Pyrinomonadaceae bacterium]
MKTIFYAVGLVLFCCLQLTPCFAQGSGGERVADSAAGFSFGPPAGFTADRGPDGYSFLNPEKTILLVVRPHRFTTFEAAVRETTLDPGTKILVQPQDIKGGGKFVRLAKPTAQGYAIVDIFVLFSPNGGGVTIIGLADQKNADSSLRGAAEIAKSIVFTRPQAPTGSAPSSASSSGWQSVLTGKHLLYLYSGSGYFEEKHIYLCSSGVFLQKTGQGGYSGNADGPSFGAQGGKRGNWMVNGNTLVLRFQDGSVGQYTLTRRQASNEVGLNGNRYFLENQSVCQ